MNRRRLFRLGAAAVVAAPFVALTANEPVAEAAPVTAKPLPAPLVVDLGPTIWPANTDVTVHSITGKNVFLNAEEISVLVPIQADGWHRGIGVACDRSPYVDANGHINVFQEVEPLTMTVAEWNAKYKPTTEPA